MLISLLSIEYCLKNFIVLLGIDVFITPDAAKVKLTYKYN